eukprot:9401500-Pyramimonas_sp.AAC.1
MASIRQGIVAIAADPEAPIRTAWLAEPFDVDGRTFVSIDRTDTGVLNYLEHNTTMLDHLVQKRNAATDKLVIWKANEQFAALGDPDIELVT